MLLRVCLFVTGTSELAEMEAHNVDLIERLNGNGLVFTLSWTLTAQVADIVRGLPPNATVPRTLYELVRPATNRLDSFVRERERDRLGTVLTLDFFEETSVVEVAKTWARRDCNDDAEYRARASDGNDCRGWAEAGRCTSDPAFMLPACPLSCGVCVRLDGEPGDPCTDGAACLSGICGPLGLCLTDDPLPEGAPCGVDSQCASSRCGSDTKRCIASA
jgi:hypothetical protein